MTSHVTTDVLEIAYEEHGPPDGPLVVCVHGFPDDATSFDAVGGLLAQQGYRVLAPHLRGFGPTRFLHDATPRSGQLGALVADLLAFVDAMDLDRVTLVGQDWGSRAAQGVAAMHPERVEHLVSLGSYGLSWEDGDGFPPPLVLHTLWYQWLLLLDLGEAVLHADRRAFLGFKGSSQHPDEGWAGVGRAAGWTTQVTGRPAMRSPGRPPPRREVQREFWRGVARGLSSEDAAVACGVSAPVGSRWFRHGGGMPPLSLVPPSGRYLSFAEREEIALARAAGGGVRDIARQLGRAPSTVSRELRRNAATRGSTLTYRPSVAQWKADVAARRPKATRLASDDRLRTYVSERLAGEVTGAGGRAVPGPRVAWKGRRHGRRADRRWGRAWSPQQIAARLRLDFPDDASMRISHEAIYQALYVQGRGALRRDLSACLRTGRALRVPRARTRGRGKTFVTTEVMISQRPAEVADRAVPGHWEGDLIIGLGSSAIGTLVERTTRFTMLLHLPPLAGHGSSSREKNGPPLAGHGAHAVRDAITDTLVALPEQLRRSLTWDQGAELAHHAQLTVDSGLDVYFCDPHSPWQRGTNENTNGLLRQYFPKGTDLARHSRDDLDAVAATLNSRPRKTLGYQTPSEAFNELLLSAPTAGVATTT